MEFEYDQVKNRENLAKHGIDFVESQKLWHSAVLVVPSRHGGERRELAIGLLDGVFWTAVVTRRGAGRLRLISIRRSRKEEKHAYHQAMEGENDENEPQESGREI